MIHLPLSGVDLFKSSGSSAITINQKSPGWCKSFYCPLEFNYMCCSVRLLNCNIFHTTQLLKLNKIEKVLHDCALARPTRIQCILVGEFWLQRSVAVNCTASSQQEDSRLNLD